METRLTELEGIKFLVPITFVFPFKTLAECGNCCGPGSGIAELMIPEVIWGLRMSPVCLIHDESLRLAKPSWDDFRQINSMALTNAMAMIRKCPSAWFGLQERLRTYSVAMWYGAVVFGGGPYFWFYKSEQAKENKQLEDGSLAKPSYVYTWKDG